MRTYLLGVALTMVLIVALAASAVEANPFVGTWKLNVPESEVTDPGLMPMSEVRKTIALDNGLKNIVDGVNADGKAYHGESSARFDEKDYPITGDPTIDSCMLNKMDATSLEIVLKKAGKEVRRYYLVVSKSGKRQIVTGRGKNIKGEAYQATFIFDKQ
jgi:hypothetical protein